MSDFDITTFRSKPKKKTGKRKSLRDATKVSTPFIEYLEKRKALGLDESDPESDEEAGSKKKQRNCSDVANSERAASQPARKSISPVKAPVVTDPEPSSSPIILLDSDDDATACTEQSTLSKPVPERAIIMPELTQSSPIVANKKDEPVSLQPEQSSLSLLDDFDDLDPDLASSLMENSPDRSFHDISTDQSSSVKLTLKFQMILYPNVESFQEPSVKDISVLQKILKVYVMDRDPLDRAIDAFVSHKRIQMDNVVFVYNNTKLWPIATPAGLGMRADQDNHIDVYFKDQWEQKMREEEQMKHERLAQLQPTEELSDDEMEKAQESSRSTEVAEDSTLLRLTIRGKDGKDSKMKVKPTTTISTLVKHYRTLNNLEEVQVKLMWDDLVLDENQQVQDTDLEDEDMISASW